MSFGVAKESTGEFLDTDRDKKNSIRFNSMQEFDVLIQALIKAKVIYGRKLKKINQYNFQNVLKDQLEMVEDAYRIQIL